MANVTTHTVILDGTRNAVIKFEGILDTSDLGATVIADPATLGPMFGDGRKATMLRIDKLQFYVEDGLAVDLYWTATTPIRIEELVGRSESSYRCFGGLYPTAANQAAAGFTGQIQADTQGWAASAVLSFTVILHLVKLYNG